MGLCLGGRGRTASAASAASACAARIGDGGTAYAIVASRGLRIGDRGSADTIQGRKKTGN